MATVARRLGPERELALVQWRDGQWLFAQNPLVHFGYRGGPDEVEQALTWLRGGQTAGSSPATAGFVTASTWSRLSTSGRIASGTSSSLTQNGRGAMLVVAFPTPVSIPLERPYG